MELRAQPERLLRRPVRGNLDVAQPVAPTRPRRASLRQPRVVLLVVAILVAMVVAWLLHRRLTFRVSAPPSLTEFLRFAGVAWTANAINYLVYAGILILWPATAIIVALIASTLIAAIFSYVGFRFGVFRQPPPVA